jgi:hypothetical protein
MLSLFSFLKPPVISSLFGLNILLNTLFSNTLSLFPSLNVRDQVSHPYRTTGKIINKSFKQQKNIITARRLFEHDSNNLRCCTNSAYNYGKGNTIHICRYNNKRTYLYAFIKENEEEVLGGRIYTAHKAEQ